MQDIQHKLEMYENLEKTRKSLMISSTIVYSVFVALSVALIFFGLPYFSIIILIGVIFIYNMLTRGKRQNYKAEFIELLVKAPLEQNFDDLRYHAEWGINKDVIAYTGMMKMGNRYESNDYINATYKGTAFEQSDVCIQNVQNTGKTTTTTTYFKGRWMIFEFNKDFCCNMLVYEKSFHYANNHQGIFSKDNGFQEIQFEDMNFNKEFHTYSNNTEEAFYIMTPQMMEAIRELKKNTSGELILCFIDNKVHIGVNNNRNAFEPPIYRKIDIAQLQGEVYDDIRLITNFVDALKLNEKVYKQ